MMRYLSIISLLLLISACSKEKLDDCFTSLGENVIEERNISGKIHSIAVSDRISVVLVQDSVLEGTVLLDAPEGLIDQVKAESNAGVLNLSNENTCNFVRSYDFEIQVTVYIDVLTDISIESIASVTCKDTLVLDSINIFNSALSDSHFKLNCREVRVESSNSASTFIEGEAMVLRANIEEVSDLDAQGLIAQEVIIDTHTPLHCYFDARKGIYGKIYGPGDLVYLAEPSLYKVIAEKVGTGVLRKK